MVPILNTLMKSSKNMVEAHTHTQNKTKQNQKHKTNKTKKVRKEGRKAKDRTKITLESSKLV